METIEKFWKSSGITDSKHILNTSTKQVEQIVLNEIEQSGVTVERLQELEKSGLHIYMYETQITIHGLFPELCNNYLSGYKILFQNKNKSIGVKWQGIDNAKKKYIYSLCEFAGWHTYHNSNDWLIYRQKLCKTITEANEQANELKRELNGLDTSLFYGYASIEARKDIWGRIWAVAEVCINGIYESNVNTVIEQVTGKKIAELETIKAELLKERELERIEQNKKWELERIERNKKEAILNEQRAKWEQANKLNDFIFVEKNPIANGQIYATAKITDNKMVWVFTAIKKIGANLCQYECDKEGTKLKKASQCYYKTFTGYLKKEVKQVAKQTPQKASANICQFEGIKIINYSDKAIAVIGNTKLIKDTLKSLGGRFNLHLNCGAGWIFPKVMESKLIQLIK